MTRTVGIYLFDDIEVLDFAGPFEVFSTASRVKSRLEPNTPKSFEVFTIADMIRTISTRGGLIVQPHFDITSHPRLAYISHLENRIERQDTRWKAWKSRF